MSLPRLIGITGRSGVGKDTLADALVAHFGYSKYSLAQPIKALLNSRFGWTDAEWRDRSFKETGHPQCGYEWQGSPRYFSPRSWAQWLGTEVGRNIGGEDVWVNQMEREWKQHTFTCGPRNGYQPRMVVPDVRFDNEARRIRQLGGVVILVERPSAQPVRAHVSESGVSPELINARVVNDIDVDSYLTNAVKGLAAVSA